jgi:uncharacterized protein YndB with AHSA1/START domain
MKNSLKVTTPSDREIVLTRSFDAPGHLVWAAMTKPELIKRWLFAPPGWSMTVCREDMKVGGSFRWEWAGADGKTLMVIRGVYREIVPFERIVRSEIMEFGGNETPEVLGTLRLTEQGGKTTITLTEVYPSKEARDAAIASGMESGVAAGYNQLEAMLASGEIK